MRDLFVCYEERIEFIAHNCPLASSTQMYESSAN